MTETFSSARNFDGYGFSESDYPLQTSEILDKLSGVGTDFHSLNKMGTSIPTPLARMFLINAAYSEIMAKFAEHGNDVAWLEAMQDEDEDGNPIQYTSAYHQIISDHLDLLELIYTMPDRLNAVKWFLPDQIKAFAEDTDYEKADANMKNLGDALVSAFHEPALDGVNTTYLFFFDNKIAVGGTSPHTLVYTNPNWPRYLQAENPNLGNIYGGEARPLFSENRDLNFRKLIYLLSELGKFQGEQIEEFNDYVQACLQRDVMIRDWLTELKGEHLTDLDNSYLQEELDKIAAEFTDKSNVTVTNCSADYDSTIPLYKRKGGDSGFRSQYLIKMSAGKAPVETINGETVEIKTPMFLTKDGIAGAIYYGTTKWDPLRHRLPDYSSIEDVPLTKRQPVGTGLDYPFLVAEDLLEDKIIEVPYNIDNSNFYTFTKKNISILLPLKERFFQFFSIEDLVANNMLAVEYDDDNCRATVRLTIPLLHHPKPIVITKTYDKKDVVVCSKTASMFNIGFFPFFKVKNGSNIFNIFLGRQGNPVDLHFYKQTNPLTPIEAQVDARTKGSGTNTVHVLLKEAFDIVAVKLQGASGMILPKMRSIEAGHKNYIFAVDFGTSNTHIAYAEQGNVKNTIRAFDITPADTQVVCLNKPGATKFIGFNSEAIREFAPQEIGTKVKFPIRTALYEVADLKNQERPRLFGHMSIGFNFPQEIVDNNTGNRYETDLKWNLHAIGMSTKRVEAFCKEVLMLLRNKALLNNGSESFELMLTYPQAMRKPLFNSYRNAWTRAIQDLGLKVKLVESNYIVESVAPYVCMRSTDKLPFSDIFVNIDIGGGSTDILYVRPVSGKEKIYRSYSAFFAANDLWGVGCDPDRDEQRNNGFTDSYEVYDPNGSAKGTPYRVFKENWARSASDVVSWLFANKPDNFTDAIRNDQQLLSCVITHFSAIIYYLALIIKTEELKVPNSINFTGMGSKYLDIMMIGGGIDEVENLINTIFKYVLKTDCDIRVTRADNPKEVTANGAVFMANKTLNANGNSKSSDVVNPIRGFVYGIKGEADSDDGVTLTGNDVLSDLNSPDLGDNVANATIAQYFDFVKMLGSDEFSQAASDIGNYSYYDLQDAGIETRSLADNSFQIMASTINDTEKGQPFKESLFFWPLKDTLYVLASKSAR